MTSRLASLMRLMAAAPLTPALLAAALLAAHVASAADVAQPTHAPLSRDALNPATEVPEVRTLKSDVLAPPSEGPCPIDVPGLTFHLKAVTFQGASTAGARDLSAPMPNSSTPPSHCAMSAASATTPPGSCSAWVSSPE